MVIFLTILPVWLVASTAIGLWLWHKGGEGQPEPAKLRTPVSVEGLESDLKKIVEIAGPRHVGSDRGAIGLRRISAMIRGTLGPENAGYLLEVHPGPPTERGSWPIVIARLPGEGPPLAVVAGYDAPADRVGVEFNGTGVASLLAVAQAMAGESPGRPVAFAFVPHAYDEKAPLEETARRLVDHLGEVGTVVLVEATGGSERLIASAHDRELLAPFEGRVAIAEVEDSGADPFGPLFEMGAPLVRVASQGGLAERASNERLPDPAVHAAATGRLGQLVGALAAAP